MTTEQRLDHLERLLMRAIGALTISDHDQRRRVAGQILADAKRPADTVAADACQPLAAAIK